MSNSMLSRSARRVAGKLGIIPGEQATRVRKFRDDKLDALDAYYESRQYDHLYDWEESSKRGQYVPTRKRKPRLQFNFAKALSDRITAKLIGKNVFPQFQVEDDPMTEDFIQAVVRASKLSHRLLDPIRRMCVTGSVLVRFYVEGGALKVTHYPSKYCYPGFFPHGELSFCKIQYVYEDVDDLDERGKPRQKWYRLDLGPMQDTLYDNPEYKPNVEPQFTVVEANEHGLGFVQAEWFRTTVQNHSPDGDSVIEDILGFIDELNYSLSQSSQAVSYNQDPILAIKNMDEDEMDQLIRTSSKAWNLGREGEAQFLESTLKGVQTAMDFRDKVRLSVQDIARIVLLDPEKMVGHAQSAKAMEVLHGPLIELINELRPVVEEKLVTLVQKMAVTVLVLARQGAFIPLRIPEGFVPKSLNITLSWPPIFPLTMQDLQQKVSVVSSATGANLLSRETGTKWLAKDFGVEDVDEEIRRISAQPVLNPFGMF